MSNRPYDLAVDATDGDDEILTSRAPDHAEDDGHHNAAIEGNLHQEEEEENLHDEDVADSEHPPLDLEHSQDHRRQQIEHPRGKREKVQEEEENNEELETEHQLHHEDSEQEGDSEEDEVKAPMTTKPMEPKHDLAPLTKENSQDVDEENDSDDEQVSHHAAAEGLYDPAEFQHLPVGSDIKELFQFITQYTAQVVETDNVLKPFILDYIPSVGDIDAFIKVPRPDDVDDNLGLTVLDEPAAKQSDPTVLDLQMRAVSKGGVPKTTVVKKLVRADKNSKEIENWIKNISELHKSKPATNVHYSKPMPDIDNLMQEWPPEVEDVLRQIELPTSEMDMTLEEYVDMICCLLDIPVHKSRVQSLHVLFSLYSEFKNSQHFKGLTDDNRMETESYNPKPASDSLVL